MDVDTSVFKKFTRQGEQIADNYYEMLAEEYLTVMKRKIPKKSGKLARSYSVVKKGDKFILGTNLDYAFSVINGRGKITAKKGKVLHFKNDGKDVFVKSVGPVKGNNYLEKTTDRVGTGTMKRMLSKAIKKSNIA